MHVIVCIKQVPDTANVKINPETNTLMRDGVESIVNPFDEYALELALLMKDSHGAKVSAITMGPPQADVILREALARGADEGILLTDRAFAGADTLATSYSLAQAIKKIGDYDIILCGRQAIDGDTAQVGPQVAEKLGLTQITYAEEILDCTKDKIVVKRHIDGGVETVEGPMPIVVTVNGSAAPCRSRNAKLLMKYKKAMTTVEIASLSEEDKAFYEKRPYLSIKSWGAADIDADPAQIGKAGSPTNVKAVKSIVFKAKENKTLTSSDADVESLIVELLENNTIG